MATGTPCCTSSSNTPTHKVHCIMAGCACRAQAATACWMQPSLTSTATTKCNNHVLATMVLASVDKQHCHLVSVAGYLQQQAYGAIDAPARQLYDELMRYRASLRLPSIPLCTHLNAVAAWHVYDLQNTPRQGNCGMHSWSTRRATAGSTVQYSGCCYVTNQLTTAMSNCMWNKPREISRGAYRGNGHEIAFMSGGRATPLEAVQGWKTSPSHRDVIVNAAPA